MNHNYQEQNNWNEKLTPQELIDFAITIGKNAVELYEDWDFHSDNIESLRVHDIFLPVRRLGKTEERYKKEIATYIRILNAKNFVNQSNFQFQQSMHYSYPYNFSIWDESNRYRNKLVWHTENIPIYVAIRYGEKGIDWILGKFGEAVKRCYYEREKSQN